MIEGFARGSHLRQHIWEMVVTKIIQQLTDDEKDFIWFILRRDIWDMFLGRSHYDVCGDEDFLHCMAALHRGNHRLVKFYGAGDKSKETSIYCYRFNNAWHPIDHFNQYIPRNGWYLSPILTMLNTLNATALKSAKKHGGTTSKCITKSLPRYVRKTLMKNNITLIMLNSM